MVSLANFASDPTLDAINTAVENAAELRQKKAPFMGASTIGEPCERKVFFNWRMAKAEKFTAEQLYRFDDGFRSESAVAERFAIAGISIKTIDPNTGYQFAVSDVDGHLRGRLDGLIDGLVQAPKVMHVWECKATNSKKLAALSKAKTEHGEEHALKEWDLSYYAQAIIYCYKMNVDNHYLTCVSEGAREMVSVTTPANHDYAKSLIEKARRVKDAIDLPVAISTDAAHYKCKMCNFYELCHQNRVAQVNCRTCAHASPIDGGEWFCVKYNRNVPQNFQVKGCDKHVFMPAFITYAKAIDASVEENWVEYEKADGTRFKNGSEGCYTSKELSNAQDYRAIGIAPVDKLKSMFNAEVIA